MEKMKEKEARNWLVFCHLGGIIPVYLMNLIIPAAIWLIKKNESGLIETQGKEAVNFQISLTIYGVVLMIIGFTVIGLPIAMIGGIALYVTDVICVIQAAIKASNGQDYKYPINLRLIK